MGNKTNVAVGDKFGNRTIIEFVESNNKHRKVKVRCDCGKEEIIQLSPLLLDGGKAHIHPPLKKLFFIIWKKLLDK